MRLPIVSCGGARPGSIQGMAYTLEQRAEVIAEHRLTGSVSHAARHLGVKRETARKWIREAAGPLSGQDEEMAARAIVIAEAKRVGLDDAYRRAVELQHRDLPLASFYERTGFVKVIGEQRQLAAGKPTQITQAVTAEQARTELEELRDELAERRARRPAV